MSKPQQQKIGDYDIIQGIRRGTTAKVLLCEHNETKMQVAIKCIKKANFSKSPQLQNKIHREIALMRLLNHPHLLKLHEVCESGRHIYMILEYAQHGELFDYLIQRQSCPLDVSLKFFRQIIYGLEFLHVHAICHRDLKPENILLDENDDIKIADFGFARWMKSNIAETSCGSPHYAAPEVIRGIPYDGRAADIWSCGVILYALVVGRLPFDDPAIRNLLAKVKCGQYIMPDYLPRPIQDLIGRMLIINPQERIRIESIKEHPAFKMFLPGNYTIPTPLPIPSITEVMYPDELDPDILKTLIEIGFADEDELMAEFTREGHSMAKVFYSMLTTNLTLESLPWNSNIEEHPREAFIQSPQTGNFQIGGASPDFQPESNPIGSEVFSLAEKAQWASLPQNEYKYEVIQPCLGIQIPLEQLMMNLQHMLTSLHFQWFHPDDFTIFSRRADDMMYLVARVQRENEFLNMNLYFSQASQMAISNILDAVRNMLTPNE